MRKAIKITKVESVIWSDMLHATIDIRWRCLPIEFREKTGKSLNKIVGDEEELL